MPVPDPRPIRAETGDLISEDEVKQAMKEHVESQGYDVTVMWGRERGIDIDARRGGEHLVIEAKGQVPSQQQQTNYFLGALGGTRSEDERRCSDVPPGFARQPRLRGTRRPPSSARPRPAAPSHLPRRPISRRSRHWTRRAEQNPRIERAWGYRFEQRDSASWEGAAEPVLGASTA